MLPTKDITRAPFYKKGSWQHLYFLSDDEIKANDYAYHKLDGKVILVTEDLLDGDIRRFGYSKVIVSTDSSLCLPQPPQGFIDAYIKSYNEGKPITEVMVEYINNYYDVNRLSDWEEPKIDKHNTITITRTKDNWTREECQIKLLTAITTAISYPEIFCTGICTDGEKIKQWIEQNL